MKLSEKLARHGSSKQDTQAIETSLKRSRELTSILLGDLPPLKENDSYQKGDSLLAERGGTALCYLLTDGTASLRASNRITLLAEAGDCMGLATYHERKKEIEIVAESDVKAHLFRVSDVLDHIDASEERRRAFTELRSHQTFLLQRTVAHNIVFERERLKPRIKTFRPGKTIIKENAKTSDVFVILEGRAVATKNGQPVGTIREDEIFGAIAAITGEPRSASVTAINECRCLVYTSDEFYQLLEDCPGIVLTMIDGMARAIASATQKLVR